MKLTNVEIKNYKSIRHIDLYIGYLTAIVGKNNYGKSAILDGIQCFYGEKQIDDDNFHLGTKEGIEITLTFSELGDKDIERYFDYKSMRRKTLLKIKESNGDKSKEEKLLQKLKETRDKKFTESIEKLNLSYPDEQEFTISFHKAKSGNGVYKINNDFILSRGDVLKFVSPIKVISAIRTPDKETTAGTKTNMKELISLLQDGDNSKDFIEVPQFDKKLSYDELKELISQKEEKKCFYLTEDLTRNFQNAINTDSLSVRVKIDNTFKFDFKYKTVLIDKDLPDREIDILSCGTGLQSMMILSILQTYIKMNNNSDFILLIEEPEVYLHPSLQRKMINTLNSISENNQFLLTTHSPIIVSKIDKSNVHCVNKESGVTRLVDASAENIIDELGIQITDILNKNAVVFVEGKDDSILFKQLIDKIAENKGYGVHFTDRQIDIIQTDGFDKMCFYANAKILHKDAVRTPFWVITDSDGVNVEDRKRFLIDKGLSNGVRLLSDQLKVLTEYAIESYFLDHTLLNTVFGIELEAAQKMCDRYFLKYEEERLKVQRNQASKKNFQQNFKPKIIFSNLGKQPATIEHILTSYYGADEEFKSTRTGLIQEWEQKEEPISYVLDKLTLEQLKETKMVEIVSLLEDVVDIVQENQR
ncbi:MULTISPECIES: ATP-dependent endonuclease [unclassified Bacillus (in: firmicutes)]|uniref:ATP-dependent nuclease n=1 Tax=unclassified Bacillus (in: firmicutes) TaxID=185979 RepID=UPI0008E65EE9|nr:MULTISPECIES: AAA family ATPase [unclassified Bacillus (in: firmicutes)]SFB25622.1 Predicted ATP-dependent endonuclease of the OLD family, contains P-loop ATPase and TOPRIM domains [Bacillus sp. UNCCL13]SFQ91784.1 Predicted ATP-dependent endonuclease of the OLD family, contains P-loop ATPase and TOPRIM domains [Bacillus sp. cl95]